MLASVPPIIGIYTAFFPVLVYSVFGTSKHNSMGTFAVISIMVGKVVAKYAFDPETVYASRSNISITGIDDTAWDSVGPLYTPLQVVSSLCLVIACIQASSL